MAMQRCAICHKDDISSKMKCCNSCDLWFHYTCAGGGVDADAHCPKCRIKLG